MQGNTGRTLGAMELMETAGELLARAETHVEMDPTLDWKDWLKDVKTWRSAYLRHLDDRQKNVDSRGTP